MSDQTTTDEKASEAKVSDENMPLREWYTNKTKTAFRALIGASLLTGTGAVLLWILAELPFLTHMQTFNGAIVIPAAGGIWIAAFMYIWLIPMRELSFRGQESLDRTEKRFKEALDDKILPAVEVWTRIGKNVEETILPKLEKAIDETRARVGPAYESVRRLENAAVGNLGVLTSDVRAAAKSVLKFFSPDGKEADLDAAVDLMMKGRDPLSGNRNGNGKTHVAQPRQ